MLPHGWPSSFFEFLPLVGPLTDPVAHETEPTDAFDRIIPSLPGFGFSRWLPAGESHPARIADLWVQVMDELGYKRRRSKNSATAGLCHSCRPVSANAGISPVRCCGDGGLADP